MNVSKTIIRKCEEILDDPWLGILERVGMVHAKLFEEYMRRSIDVHIKDKIH